ncbi:MAG: ISAzo13 family transposase [Thermodesulfobacteriota bacterium]
MIKKRFNALKPHLDERMVRLVAAAEAKVLGHGGITTVSRAMGLSRNTVARGMEELESIPAPPARRTRRHGGGRRREVEKDLTLMRDLECLMEPLIRGGSSSPLQWTCKSLRRLADELKARGHTTSHRMVGELLHEMGYRFQARKQVPGGASRLKRHAWFERIHQCIEGFHQEGLPVIYVVMQKRGLVYRSRRHDSGPSFHGVPEKPVANLLDAPESRGAPLETAPDENRFSKWIPIGADRSSLAIAVESIRRWWMSMGSPASPEADALLVTADGAGGGIYCTGSWKEELQRFANESGLSLTVLHLPSGMCKWNRIEDRYVSCIRQEWYKGPCTEYRVIVNVIAAGKAVNPCEDLCPPGAPFLEDDRKRPGNKPQNPCLRNKYENEAWGFTLDPRPRKAH